MHERRKHQRYLLDQSCFLTYSTSVGTIVDISMGGLSCICLEENKCGGNPAKKGIDIFCGQATLFAQGILVSVIDTTVVRGEFDAGLKLRKCHVKFNKLEHDQKIHLEEVISSHTNPSTYESESISPN